MASNINPNPKPYRERFQCGGAKPVPFGSYIGPGHRTMAQVMADEEALKAKQREYYARERSSLRRAMG